MSMLRRSRQALNPGKRTRVKECKKIFIRILQPGGFEGAWFHSCNLSRERHANEA